MTEQKLFEKINQSFKQVVRQDTPEGISLLQSFLQLHPADAAEFFDISRDNHSAQLFVCLPSDAKKALFEYLSHQAKITCLSAVNNTDRSLLLASLPMDDLADLFDELSDDELKKYCKLLRKREREQVLSLLKFKPDSAGGVMDTNIISLTQDLTVEKSIALLQRLQPNKDLHQQIFVTSKSQQLVGYINLEDLVLRNSKARLSSIMHKNELVVDVYEDREVVAHDMIHYHLTIAPVVDSRGLFLGVIPSDTLIDIVEQEATEDIYRISALSPIKHTYFETSFFSLFRQRATILTTLLLAQSFSTIIMEYYEAILGGFLIFFLPMLTSTGGNAGGQTSALVIQGLASGDINETNRWRFFKRELLMAFSIALILGSIAFMRVMFVHGDLYRSGIISGALMAIVMVSIILGSSIPFILKKCKLDPATSSGPFLGTLMDVVGVLIYCLLIKAFL